MLSALAADRVRVANLNAEILVLERALSALRIQRAQAQESLDSYKYPVLTLPNEIITEIFVHVVPKYPDQCPTSSLRHSPVLLTQICREWRDIALQTPALWRAIVLPSLAEQAARFDPWLSRARGYPLSLFYDMDSIEDNRQAGSLSTIIPYRAQLEYLAVHQCLPSNLRAIEGPLPLLRHLELVLYDRDDPLTTKVSFLEAPLLRTALLNYTGLHNLILPWAQLTSLALDSVRPRECAPILQQTSNLVHCELGLMKDWNPEDIPDVTLPSLQSLLLTYIGENGPVTRYLQTITVPALRSLRVPEPFLGPNSVDALKLFVSKSGCKLEELCVTGTASESDASYQTAFPSTKVSFAASSASFVNQWLIEI
ncbi:hypothetical protein C8R45DRAFT_1030357 [Mycena sanguinolenta]|nr:hypothetical protein C8R45DRAFT_1030357 [Mycena sanguinolenta]